MAIDLAEFVLARNAEREANAHREMVDVRTLADVAAGRDRFVPGSLKAGDARVLAECDATRRIVKLHRQYERAIWDESASASLADPIPTGLYATRDALAEVLRLLALPDADHPDYDEAWRP